MDTEEARDAARRAFGGVEQAKEHQRARTFRWLAGWPMDMKLGGRTREIGVRVALGAGRWRVITAMFRRPLLQVGLGVLVGNVLLALAGSVETEMPGLTGKLSPGQLVILAAYGVVMLGVCLLACIVPTRRALRVEPTVALRMD
jgi:ABC-type antimicrobial peptide transport system permease subunit